MTDFARRPAFEGGSAGLPHHDVAYSRWGKSPTTFGPVGRILATVLVLLMGPWGANSGFILIWTPVWIAVSVVLLKSVWQKVPAGEDQPASGVKARYPKLFAPIGGRWLGPAFIVIAVIGYGLALTRMGTGGRFVLMAITGCVGMGLVLAWMAEG